MRKRLLFDTTLSISPIALGVPTFGSGIQPESAERLYAAYREAGGNFFDTAHCYAFWIPGGDGASERTIGDMVRRHGDQNNVVIATKGGHPSAGPAYYRPASFLSPEVVNRDVNESLDRLGAATIDLYYLHRDDERVPVGEVMDLLHEHVVAGRMKFLGASNWTTARIAAGNAYAHANGKTPFVANQPMYSLGKVNEMNLGDPTMKTLSDADYDWHARTGLAVCAYTSTANGYFATAGERGGGTFDNPISRARLQRAQAIAKEIGATPNQVAIAYLLHHPFQVVPILGTSQVEHLRDALGATAIELTDEQYASLRDAK